jgi:hypothetical protein
MVPRLKNISKLSSLEGGQLKVMNRHQLLKVLPGHWKLFLGRQSMSL